MSQPGTFGTIEIPTRVYTFQDGSKQERTITFKNDTQYEMDLGDSKTMKESSEKRGDWWKEYSATYKHPTEDLYFPTTEFPDNVGTSTIDYKFDEDQAIEELTSYIDSTYDGHYSKNKFQSTEFIVDCGHGDGFCMGNIIKYAQRYGKKDGKNRKDLLKILHYAIIALSVLDDELNGENENEDL